MSLNKIDGLLEFIMGKTDQSQFTIKPSMLSFISQVHKQKTDLISIYNPLIEACFMFMRGHNVKLDDASAPDKPACADGVYLGLLKSLGEIDSLRNPAINVPTTAVVDCL